MNKIKQWFTKMNKFEKIVLIIFAMFLTFIFLICLINIVVAIAYAGIKLKSVNWNNFSIAFIEDICFNISAIIATLITLIFSSFILYQKWKNFDMFRYEQKKKEKKIVQEFKKNPKNNLVMLNNKVGLIKSNLTKHTLLIGTTGSGKTTTALSIINQLVYKLNQTVIIIDGKGDDSLINKVKTIDNNAFVWVIGGKNVYNPLSSKNHIILSDKIMSLFDFSEPHYQAIAHNYLLFLIKILINKSFAITFENIVKYFPIKKVKTLLSKDYKEYDILKKFLDNENDIKGFEHRLSIYAEQLNKSIGYENDLSILVKNHKVILFSLNSFKYPELASNMGKLLIQDLKEFATIKPQNQNINLIFDEFNLFVTDAVINLINKSRSFNYQCFLCFQ